MKQHIPARRSSGRGSSQRLHVKCFYYVTAHEKAQIDAAAEKMRRSFSSYSAEGILEVARRDLGEEAPPPPQPLSLSAILDALESTIGKSKLTSLIRQNGVDFTLTPAIERQLRSAGASTELLFEILKAAKRS
jgi:hypothetical protein